MKFSQNDFIISCSTNLITKAEKKIKDEKTDFCHIKLTLKIKFW